MGENIENFLKAKKILVGFFKIGHFFPEQFNWCMIPPPPYFRPERGPRTPASRARSVASSYFLLRVFSRRSHFWQAAKAGREGLRHPGRAARLGADVCQRTRSLDGDGRDPHSIPHQPKHRRVWTQGWCLAGFCLPNQGGGRLCDGAHSVHRCTGANSAEVQRHTPPPSVFSPVPADQANVPFLKMVISGPFQATFGAWG